MQSYDTRLLYARMAKIFAAIIMPTHHARADHTSLPTGSELRSARTVVTIEDMG